MKSNNPVFNRSAEFNGQAGYGQTMTDPSQWGTGAPGYQQHTDRMTIDSVVQKTGISPGVVIVVALATWILTPEVTAQADLSPLIAAMTIGRLGSFPPPLVNPPKRV